MTDHSKARAGKAPNKNHKVMHIAHARVKVAAENLHKVAGIKAQKGAADAKVDAPVKHKSAGMDAHKVSATVKTGTHKAASGLKKKAEVR